jgi:hypothetical protein
MSPKLDRDHPDAPKYWKNETGGRLAAAVHAYLDNPAAMTVRDMALMRAYLSQWIQSPAWDANPRGAQLVAELRAGVGAIRDARDLQAWMHACEDAGLDPL